MSLAEVRSQQLFGCGHLARTVLAADAPASEPEGVGESGELEAALAAAAVELHTDELGLRG
jgi:hypothetical protein